MQHAHQQIRHVQDETLRRSVEKFAACFWELPPDVRRQRWSELHDKSSLAPRARARLEEMQPVLAMHAEAADTSDEIKCELVQQLQALSVCPPLDRPLLRKALIERAQGIGEWRAAVQAIRVELPELAQLHKDFLRALGAPRRVRSEPPRIRQPAVAAPQPVRRYSGGGGSSFRFSWVLVLAAITMARMVTMAPGCRPQPTYRYSDPSDVQIKKAFEDYQKNLKLKKHYRP
jgi:hypothetical protein